MQTAVKVTFRRHAKPKLCCICQKPSGPAPLYATVTLLRNGSVIFQQMRGICYIQTCRFSESPSRRERDKGTMYTRLRRLEPDKREMMRVWHKWVTTWEQTRFLPFYPILHLTCFALTLRSARGASRCVPITMTPSWNLGSAAVTVSDTCSPGWAVSLLHFRDTWKHHVGKTVSFRYND